MKEVEKIRRGVRVRVQSQMSGRRERMKVAALRKTKLATQTDGIVSAKQQKIDIMS